MSNSNKIHVVGSNSGTVTDATRKRNSDAKLREMATAKVMQEAQAFRAQIMDGVDASKLPSKFVEQLCFTLVSILTGVTNRTEEVGGHVMQLGSIATHAHASSQITIEALGRLEAQRYRQAKKVQEALRKALTLNIDFKLKSLLQEQMEAMDPDAWGCENAVKMNELFAVAHEDLKEKAIEEQAKKGGQTVEEVGQKLLFTNIKEVMGKEGEPH